MNKIEIKKTLEKWVLSSHIHIDKPLSAYTFTKTGGKADILIAPSTYEEVRNIVHFSYLYNVSLTIIGNGSNLIIQDGGIRGIVLVLTKLNDIRIEENRLVAQSGATIIDSSNKAKDASLSGLEFACGIPGTVGGAVYMNAGAYGGEISDVIESALVVTPEGKLKVMQKDELHLSYRKSILSDYPYLVLEATFSLHKGEQTEIAEKMAELTDLRTEKQPLEYPSCGSVFKRPPGHYAGQLIQTCGLQGYRIGGVEVSKKHAGFMVNVDNGTASDYIALIEHVQQTVLNETGILLETEVKIIGEQWETVSN